jgi:hypothetical protein
VAPGVPTSLACLESRTVLSPSEVATAVAEPQRLEDTHELLWNAPCFRFLGALVDGGDTMNRLAIGPAILMPLILLAASPTHSPQASGPQEPAAAPLIVPAEVAQALQGHWVVNRELSEDAREKMREAMRSGGRGGSGGGMSPGGMGGGMGGRGGGMGGTGSGTGGRGGGTGGRGGSGGERGGSGGPSMTLAGTLAAHTLDLELNGAELLIIQHVRGRDGSEDKQSRLVDLTGRKVKLEGGSAESQTKWKDGKLTIESKGERGTTREQWVLVKEPRRLEIKTQLQMQGPMGGGSGVDVKRVFDAAPDDAAAPQPEPPPRLPPSPEPGR